MKKIYDQLSNDLLAGFYVEINKNINKGILSSAMYQELELIKKVAAERGLSNIDLLEIYMLHIRPQL
ncbi:hypothetical protein [Jeotgalibacillus proteolyticus]|uniref:Sporulation histidine kinase inhibitor Sda n=1 Tax=Jeotgalibacillus proteolyticus TaxID=2082395 RepID=A0A2S5G958_9BACL|nr:hypothetical protein [Jeotgalibacillus proteolyticus]PPA69518.1 hypothetical protein C4B60_13270 [Jeotgalibacillus proteolyticus]